MFYKGQEQSLGRSLVLSRDVAEITPMALSHKSDASQKISVTRGCTLTPAKSCQVLDQSDPCAPLSQQIFCEASKSLWLRVTQFQLRAVALGLG